MADTRSNGVSRRRFLQWAASSGLLMGTSASAKEAKEHKVEHAMTQPNILFITTDEHRPDALSVAGHPVVRTPHLDRLANEGVRFTNTYCQAPLCQPSRASLITGRYVHERGHTWNRFDMKPEWPTLMKQLQQAGYRTSVIGKTHFYAGSPSGSRDLLENAGFLRRFGFDDVLEEHDMFVHLAPNVRTHYTVYLRERALLDTYLAEVPPFQTPGSNIWDLYTGKTSKLEQEHLLTSYIGARSVDWLKGYRADKPWFLWVSFVAPHPPVIDDSKWAAEYRDADIPLGPSQRPKVPDNAFGTYLGGWLRGTRTDMVTPDRIREVRRHYYGMVSLIDEWIGEIVAAADASVSRDTWVVFTADHGDMLGDHGLVFKNVFYRPSVVVPHIVRPPRGTLEPRIVDHPVQHIDLTATMAELAGAAPPEGMRGESLIPLMRGEGAPREVVFSELAGHNNQGNYLVMAANERYRYVHDTLNDVPCELFDLREDPEELVNLVDDAGHREMRDSMLQDYILPFLDGKVG